MEDGGRTYNVIISIIKGLAIIGVVVGHCGMSSWLEAFVNQWHLATFFSYQVCVLRINMPHNLCPILNGE